MLLQRMLLDTRALFELDDVRDSQHKVCLKGLERDAAWPSTPPYMHPLSLPPSCLPCDYRSYAKTMHLGVCVGAGRVKQQANNNNNEGDATRIVIYCGANVHVEKVNDLDIMNGTRR